MAYQKLNLSNGQVLNAEHINRIEEGIIDVEKNSSHINPDLNVVVFGDSIFDNKAARNMLKSFGCNLRNYAVSGSTISTHVRNRSTLAIEKRSSNGTILTQWDNFCNWVDNGTDGIIENNSERKNGDFTFTAPDVIILDGGANDWQNGVPLWELTNVTGSGGSYAAQPYDSPMKNPGTFYTDDDINEKIPRYDPTDKKIPTFAIQLERLMYEMSKKFPKSQRFFVKIHRIYQVKFNSSEWEFPYNKKYYWPQAKNSGYIPSEEVGYSYNQDGLYGDYLDSICHKYGFRIIDIYNDSSLNGAHTTSEVYLVQKPDAAKTKKDPMYYLTKDSYGQERVNNYRVNTGSVTRWETQNPETPKKLPFFKDENNYTLTSDPDDGKQIKVSKKTLTVCDIELFDWKGLHPTAVGYEFGYKPQLFQALVHCRKIIGSDGNFDGEDIE